MNFGRCQVGLGVAQADAFARQALRVQSEAMQHRGGFSCVSSLDDVDIIMHDHPPYQAAQRLVLNLASPCIERAFNQQNRPTARELVYRGRLRRRLRLVL